MDHLRPPGTAMPFPAPRRHSTVPATFQPIFPRHNPEPAANGSVETLYNHPSVKIVAFTVGKSAFDRLGPADDTPGTLPTSSQLERTIAVGAFQIYRAPGSVAFLRCGSALQPILPKSQCWCLDEKSSKFALQIRRPNYWRIEVPSIDDEDIRLALMLRETLDKIMQFEKTPCPFERTFTVELPERPTTPVKKRPWTPTARTVAMNWPPMQQPVTPPPEFATRTRFYNPSARRHSDFGLETSHLSLAPATPETKPEAETETAGGSETKKSDTPTRPPSRRVSEMAFRPLVEEPEALTPPLTAIPPELAGKAKDNMPQITGTTTMTEDEKPDESKAASEAPSLTITQDVEHKREPIEIPMTSSPGEQASRRPAINTAQSAEPAVSAATVPNGSVVGSQEAHMEGKVPVKAIDTQMPSQVGEVQSPNEATDESGPREGGAFEGSGELRVKRTRLAAFASRRAATAPSLKLQTPTSTINNVVENAPQERTEPGSPAESSDSFHSTESWHSPIAPPSPPMSPSRTYPFPHENIPLARVGHDRRASDYEATPTATVWERNSTGAVAGSGQGTPMTPRGRTMETLEETKLDFKPSEEATSTLPIKPKVDPEEHAANSIADTDSLSTSWSSAASRVSSPGSNSLQHPPSTTSVSISHSTPRSLSPLPPPATLFTPRGGALRRLPSTAELQVRASSAVRTIRRIPSAILNKTCEMFFSPPAHLINIMLKVAARIAAGEWRGFVFGMGEEGEVVDVRWDWSDEHDLDEGAALEGWSEADFDFAGNGLGGVRGRRKARASFAAADLSRPRGKILEYQDPWATSSEDQDHDQGSGQAEDDDPSRSWGVD
ncbi:hypothetical protein VMCG_03724 [Cytospora schulzeri]|uniref:Inheritance of peroxisomes protein 1 n=1 Tax=Cytospora schulzeri TaxID=448051 RepID=A0A423WVI5_9PEZI|nr:hypothetical protein VMCG_03724 [Valsa malicola]